MMLQTGYTTTTLYSVPIMVRGAVLGVLQFVNKLGGLTFTAEDGDTIDMFACYIGLALHHAKLYDKIRKSESKTHVSVVTVTVTQNILILVLLQVLKEVLTYHNQASPDEVKMLIAEGTPDTSQPVDISTQM